MADFHDTISELNLDLRMIPTSKYKRMTHFALRVFDRYIVPKLGMFFALLSQFFGSVMALSSKLLEQNTDFPKPLNPFEVIFIRMILTCVVTLCYSAYTRPKDFPFGPRSVRLLLVARGFSGFLGIYLLYWSFQYISLSANTVISFLNPVLTVLLAYILLGERYTIFEGIGGVFSIIGVMLVVQPSFLFPNPLPTDNSGIESEDPHLRVLGVLVALLGVCSGAFSTIILRTIGKKCDPLLSVQFFSLFSGVAAGFGLFFGPGEGFQKLTTFKQWYLFIQLGVSGFLTQFLWTCAISREKAGRIVLLSYFGMIYSIFWEIVIWHHFPTLMTCLGFLIVVASTGMIIYLKPQEVEEEFDHIESRISHEFGIDDYDDDDDDDKDNIEMSDFRTDNSSERSVGV